MLHAPPLEVLLVHSARPPFTSLRLWSAGLDAGGSFRAGLGVGLLRRVRLGGALLALEGPGCSAVLVVLGLEVLVWVVGLFCLVDLDCRF